MQKIPVLILIFTLNTFAQDFRQNPLDAARKIADRVINETSFELRDSEQKPALDIQVLDYHKALADRQAEIAIAFSKLSVVKDTTLRFGISYCMPLKIWINNSLVFENKSKVRIHFKEIAYSIFTFQDTISADLKKGENRIVIESVLEGKPVIYLREIFGAEEKPKSEFQRVNSFNSNIAGKSNTQPWLYMAWPQNSLYDSSAGIRNSLFDSLYNQSTKLKEILSECPVTKVKKLVINSNSTFKKDSFADWNYPNGALMMVINNLYKATSEERYKDFVKSYCSFIKKNIPLARIQYFEDHDVRGLFHRIFRKCMLDDAGAPALPFIDLALTDNIEGNDSLISEMVNYVYNGQVKLADGTLCRPEPEEWTVWADDLFMSVPLLLKAGAYYNDSRYTDQAVKQVINFKKYLFDEDKKLYKHGFFSKENKTSAVFWGRANGWVIWATSELLMQLPKGHPSYKQIEQNFCSHLDGIIKCQDKSGMWHQILDDNSSFEETSCTAMFITGLARAVINGSASSNISNNIFKAWDALQRKIDPGGVVKEICCGTGIGKTKEFYNSRERFDNDPRGLGAVITAAIEIDKLNKYLEHIK